uniref:Prosaposin n=1 Tax=Timema genevievae TaxID=629358 RepID=A0A7R9JYN6_TIMGE|nr:unnamed protein product [Timema genevievae]
MKFLCILLCASICGALGMSITVINSPELFDLDVCAKGPVYWCQNIKTAKSCGAVKHCIQTVWEHAQVPEDNDDICTICKNMVKQARDQLESNETQEELKGVFEGSCKLIPLKVVSKECCDLADEFIPELVETLASQMNPSVVCSVAGLCNSARIDKMLAKSKSKPVSAVPWKKIIGPSQECSDCNTVMTELGKRFHAASRDDILGKMLEACGKLSSLSDGCSAIVITYFNDIYAHLDTNLEPEGFCHISGVCSDKFHEHRKVVEVTHKSTVGFVPQLKEDIPCELCEQLVVHLKNILVANTTELEFREVLEGLCKQTRSFKSECLSLVDQYYQLAYDYLVNNLDPVEVCDLVELCKNTTVDRSQVPIWPLLPMKTIESMESSPHKIDNVGDDIVPWTWVPLSSDHSEVKVSDPSSVQLPIERLMVPMSILNVGNKQLCTFCEYFLHYLQQVITQPATEEDIKKEVDKACDELPSSVTEQCRSFVDTYGDAAVALLAQEIDPSQLCPKLSICPGQGLLLDLNTRVQDSPTCPLCLFAVQEVIVKLKDNKTEENIREELDTLCTSLPKSLITECKDFVDKYAQELVDMIVADFTPQEVCTYLKLCDPQGTKIATESSIEILSNDIPSMPMAHVLAQGDGVKVSVQRKEDSLVVPERVQGRRVGESTQCVICEFVMSKLDTMLKDKKTEEEIKVAVHDVCNYLPSTVSTDCNAFVDEYADLVISLLVQELDPNLICADIKLCTNTQTAELKVAEDPTVNGKVTKQLERVCGLIPKQDQQQCDAMVATYGPSIINLMTELTGGRYICLKIGLCADEQRQTIQLLGGHRCTWGPGYWCQSQAHAAACKELSPSGSGLELAQDRLLLTVTDYLLGQSYPAGGGGSTTPSLRCVCEQKLGRRNRRLPVRMH